MVVIHLWRTSEVEYGGGLQRLGFVRDHGREFLSGMVVCRVAASWHRAFDLSISLLASSCADTAVVLTVLETLLMPQSTLLMTCFRRLSSVSCTSLMLLIIRNGSRVRVSSVGISQCCACICNACNQMMLCCHGGRPLRQCYAVLAACLQHVTPQLQVCCVAQLLGQQGTKARALHSQILFLT